MEAQGYSIARRSVPKDRLEREYFCLQDALHLSTSAVDVLYESDQGVLNCEEDIAKLPRRHEMIYAKYLSLYRLLDEFLQKRYRA